MVIGVANQRKQVNYLDCFLELKETSRISLYTKLTNIFMNVVLKWLYLYHTIIVMQFFFILHQVILYCIITLESHLSTDWVAIMVCLMTIKGMLHHSKYQRRWLWFSCCPGLLLAGFWLHHMLR